MATTTNKIRRIDPTRTLTLQRAYMREMRRRFMTIKRLVVKAIIDNEMLMAVPEEDYTEMAVYKKYVFPRSGEREKAFMNWLNMQIEKEMLEVTTFEQYGLAISPHWQNKYIQDSYKRGLIRANNELDKKGYTVIRINQQNVDAVINTPFHLDRLGLLYSRVYSDLKGITANMEMQISRVLTQGMADGDNPRYLAKKLVSVIEGGQVGELGITDTLGRFIPAARRAETLARTEIIRAHHQAMMQEYRNWELIGVKIQAEFLTAGDGRVCEQCAAIEAQGKIYTLDEAQNLIPVHPNCFIDPQIPVYTIDGWKPIGQIKIGDLVLTHKRRFRPVYGLPRSRKRVRTTTLKLKNGTELQLTDNHPVLWATGKEGVNVWADKKEGVYYWTNAKNIRKGDLVSLINEETKWELKTVQVIKATTAIRTLFKKDLYNLSVEEDESYIVKGVVVHNCRCIALPVDMEDEDGPMESYHRRMGLTFE